MLESGFYVTDEGEVLVVFGGKIELQSVCYQDGEDIVYETAMGELPKKYEIGEEVGNPPTMEEFNKFHPVRLRFYDTKSIDVLINQLQEIKDSLNGDSTH